MTSILKFYKDLEKYGLIKDSQFILNIPLELLSEIFDDVKYLHKQEIIDAFKSGLKSPYHQDYTFVTQDNQEGTKSSQYYQETFVSKGSDEVELPKQDVEKEMFELEQQLDIPSHMRWHNRELPKQETLYTKQDIIDSVNRMYDIFTDDTLEAKKLRLKGISWHIQNTLESLKQPKQ
jgi:hypothetical protein